MRVQLFLRGAAQFVAFSVSVCLTASAQPPLIPLDDRPIDPAETQELESDFAAARDATARVAPGPEATAQRSAIADALAAELESFAASHTNSAWTPGLHVWLAVGAQTLSGYSRAIDHYRAAWESVKGSDHLPAQRIGRQATSGLAKLLALTGRLPEFDALQAEARQLVAGGSAGGTWAWAIELRTWARKHPTESYKCGLYCLDQLGRLTQPGQYRLKEIVETPSSTNGFTAADLVLIGGRAGLRLHAASLTSPTNLPVPCVLHLVCEHWVVVREQRGAFYNLYDTVAFGSRWLTALQIAREASVACSLATRCRRATRTS